MCLGFGGVLYSVGGAGNRKPRYTTELILERASPVILKTFYWNYLAFTLIPVICPARRAKPEMTGNDNEFQTGPFPHKNQQLFSR